MAILERLTLWKFMFDVCVCVCFVLYLSRDCFHRFDWRQGSQMRRVLKCLFAFDLWPSRGETVHLTGRHIPVNMTLPLLQGYGDIDLVWLCTRRVLKCLFAFDLWPSRGDPVQFTGHQIPINMTLPLLQGHGDTGLVWLCMVVSKHCQDDVQYAGI